MPPNFLYNISPSNRRSSIILIIIYNFYFISSQTGSAEWSKITPNYFFHYFTLKCTLQYYINKWIQFLLYFRSNRKLWVIDNTAKFVWHYFTFKYIPCFRGRERSLFLFLHRGKGREWGRGPKGTRGKKNELQQRKGGIANNRGTIPFTSLSEAINSRQPSPFE